jgi:eukaryotic-like serine/threonine-protein kinase
VLPFKGKDVTTDSIAKALSVGTIVSGTVAQSGDEVRVTVDMIDARTGSSIGSMSIKKTKADAFALQDTLVAEVSAALRKQIGDQVKVLTSKAGTRNAAAWEAYQRAKQTVAQGDSLLTTGDIPGAMAALGRADAAFGAVAAQDDKWAAPVSQQAILKYRVARLSVGGPMTATSPIIDAGLERANKALTIAPNDPDALEARGSLRYLQWLLNLTPAGESDKAMSASENDLMAAIKTNPAQASAMNVLSHLQIAQGRTADGKGTAGDAYLADPYLTDANKTVWRLFQASMDLDLTTESKKWCDEGARRFPNDYRFSECRLWLLMLRSQDTMPTPAKVWKAYDAFLEADKVDKPEFAKRKGMMLAAMALNRAGLADSAKSVIGRAQGDESVDQTGDLAYLEAMARAQLDEKDKAISLLSRYYAKNPQRKAFISHDEAWYFKSLENEPRYKALVGTQ